MNIESSYHFNLGVALVIIWVFWVFLYSKRRESERGNLIVNIDSILKLEVVSPLNVRFVRYFISIDTEREYVN